MLGCVVSGGEGVTTAKTDYFLKNVSRYKVLSLLVEGERHGMFLGCWKGAGEERMILSTLIWR